MYLPVTLSLLNKNIVEEVGEYNKHNDDIGLSFAFKTNMLIFHPHS